MNRAENILGYALVALAVIFTLAASVGEHREGVRERGDDALLATRAAGAIPEFRASLDTLARAESTFHATHGAWSASAPERAWRAPRATRVKLSAGADGYLAVASIPTTKPRCAVAVGDAWRRLAPFKAPDGVPACLGDSTSH